MCSQAHQHVFLIQVIAFTVGSKGLEFVGTMLKEDMQDIHFLQPRYNVVLSMG